jgi:hypothetical protein
MRSCIRFTLSVERSHRARTRFPNHAQRLLENTRRFVSLETLRLILRRFRDSFVGRENHYAVLRDEWDAQPIFLTIAAAESLIGLVHLQGGFGHDPDNRR